MQENNKKEIIIIGAGPAGLTTAYTLLNNNTENFNVTILEKSKYLGGISKTVNYNGNRMDIGGHRFFTKSDIVNNLWNEILTEQTAPSKDEILLDPKPTFIDSSESGNPETNNAVMLKRRRVSRIYYNNKFFDYPITMNMKTLKNMGFFTSVVAGMSYLKSCVFKKKETNLENFYINRFGKKLYNMFFESYTEKVWGRHPKYISADWGKQRVKGISILKILKNAIFKSKKHKKVETSLIEEFSYPKFGPGQLWEEMAKKVLEHSNCKIIYDANVCKINIQNYNIKSVEYKTNNQNIKLNADIVVSSMPIKDLVADMNEKNDEILSLTNGLPYRDFITIGFLVDKLKIQNNTKLNTLNGIVPDCWIYVQDKSVKMGRIQVFNNWSPYLVKDFPNKIWLSLEYFCFDGDELWNMPQADFKEIAENELVKLEIINKGDVLDYHIEKVEKAYCAYFDTYSQIAKIKDYLLNINGLYCVGRNGQHRYNNMDHSCLTAIETANCIINPAINKEVAWEVNTEKEYHEKKEE